jgi:thermitase
VEPTLQREPKNAALASRLGLDRYYTVRVPEGTDVRELAAELSRLDGLVEVAELDGIGGWLGFPDDQYFGLQYSLHNIGQTIQGQAGVPDADIDAPEAWDLHTGTSDITIAIIDSGVSHSHPDLAAKLVPGWNTHDNNNDTDDSWLISHGTHCAGIAAAIGNNNEGIAGVSWGALIMPVKVLDDFGTGVESQCADGVIYAADHGANVGSMSLGYTDGTTYFHNAIIYAHEQGMVLTVATGNTPGAAIFYPAIWPETIAVGATDNRDALADFTTTGPEMTVAAPGVGVYSCWDVLFNSDTYNYLDGTSMACPHVAGLAALTWSANTSLTNDEVRSIIETTADDKGDPGWDEQFGYGRINAYAAVQAAMGTNECPPDWNGDTVLNSLDFIAYLNDFTAGDADYNGDTTTDSQDFIAFLNDFVSGC